jgi:hypothetical protein
VSRSQAGDTMTVISGAHTERTIPMSKTRSTIGDDSDMKLPDLPTEGYNKFYTLIYFKLTMISYKMYI